ncbi:MAG: Spy/CpxP family protein refolding chaperone [Thiobacillus sp.]|nr:Spy/CpxP family protein refolding chaperone [Thiobacillus sp.]
MKSNRGSFGKRALLVGLIAGGGILAASAFAVTAGDPAGKPGCEARQGQNVHARWEARHAAHLAALKDKLKLAPGQEAAWNAFASASQPGMHRMGGDRQAMRAEFEKLNTPQRLDRMQAMAEARRARMAERAEATKAFYAELTPAQQSVFDAEAMPKRHRDQHQHRHQS